MLGILLWRLGYHVFCVAKLVGYRGSSEFYFAYGANLDPKVMRRRNLSALGRRPFTLPNYVLLFDHEIPFVDAAMGSVSAQENESVPGVIYELSHIDRLRMDCQEAQFILQSYKKIFFIGPNGESIFFYQTNRSTPGLKPTKDYVGKILRGYETLPSVDPRSVKRLENQPALGAMIPKAVPAFRVRNYDCLGRPFRSLLIAYDRICLRFFAYLIFKPSPFEKKLL